MAIELLCIVLFDTSARTFNVQSTHNDGGDHAEKPVLVAQIRG